MNNKIFDMGDYSVIEIYNKKRKLYFYVFVDTDDLPKIINAVKSFSVYISAHTNYCQVYRKDKKAQGLHRLIMNTPKGLEVDHINYNGLDNRKKNLKNCTINENRFRRRTKPPLNELHWRVIGEYEIF